MPIIDKDHDESLYHQLINHFRARILDGSLPAGSRLPTEVELTKEHDISRGTVRQAMTELVNEGLLERIKGRGTFVRSNIGQQTSSENQRAQKPASKRIGLLLSYLTSDLDVDILRGVEYAAKSRGYQISFAYTEENSEQQTRDIDLLLADGVAGLIIYPLSNIEYDEAIWSLHQENIPFVLVDRYFPKLDCDYVVSDNFNGSYRATEHLIILGHKRIGFGHSAFGNMVTTTVRDRYRGYRQALAEYGLPQDDKLVFERAALGKGAPNPFLKFLDNPQRPDAIVASNDNEAILMMEAAEQLGLRIPDDFALTGFDDMRLAAHTTPPLTTVAQPSYDVGLRAVDVLIRRIQGQKSGTYQIELPTNLVVRASCGAKTHVRGLLKEDTT